MASEGGASVASAGTSGGGASVASAGGAESPVFFPHPGQNLASFLCSNPHELHETVALAAAGVPHETQKRILGLSGLPQLVQAVLVSIEDSYLHLHFPLVVRCSLRM